MNLYPWQIDNWQQLVKRHRTSGLPHALMFAGSDGTGKHELCRYTAAWLLCKQPADGPCGQCHSCQLMVAGTHPDFMICQPEEDSRQIRIETIRRLNHFIYSTPQISHCQVVILRPLEVMNLNAANALLKTLEEPPGESFLLLEAERPGSVLPTIRSRCQTISLSLPAHYVSMNWLAGQGIQPEDAEVALKRTANAPLSAYQWLTSDASGQQNHWLEQLQQWTQGSLPLSSVSDKWGKEFADVLAWWYDLSCDLMRSASGVPADLCRYGDLAHDLLNGPAADDAAGGVAVDKEKLIVFLNKLQQLNAEIMSGAAHHNKMLTIEVLLLEWRQMFIARVGASLS